MNNDDHKYRGIPGKVWERVFEVFLTKLGRGDYE